MAKIICFIHQLSLFFRKNQLFKSYSSILLIDFIAAILVQIHVWLLWFYNIHSFVAIPWRSARWKIRGTYWVDVLWEVFIYNPPFKLEISDNIILPYKFKTHQTDIFWIVSAFLSNTICFISLFVMLCLISVMHIKCILQQSHRNRRWHTVN